MGIGTLDEGRVVQNIGGYPVILTKRGNLVTGVARGRLRKRLGEIVVGDKVLYAMYAAGGKAHADASMDVGVDADVDANVNVNLDLDVDVDVDVVIEEVVPRRNLLLRPLAANVDQAVLTIALRDPDPSLLAIDRYLVALIAAGLEIVLCLNKSDLVRPKEARDLAGYYRELGFRTVLTSAVTRKGRNNLLAELYGRTSVFCGPSGVGKSALMNMIQTRQVQMTGEISAKIGRGRHTTRAARLIPLPGRGFVIDTPGFSQIDLAGIGRDRLQGCFPEMKGHSGRCRFSDCLHAAEPGCSVRAAVEQGLLPRSRYDHYLTFLSELTERERNGDRR